MDASTIQEIANQLGIGVDQILEYLPEYANSCFLGYFIPMVILIVLFFVCLIGFVVFFFLVNKYKSLSNDADDSKMRYRYYRYKDYCDVAKDTFGIAGSVLLVLLIVYSTCCIGPMIGWQTSPELMLLQTIIC